MTLSTSIRTGLLAAACFGVAGSACAQGHGGQPGGGMGGGGFGRSVGPEMRFHTTVPVGSQGGLHLGPTGRWWDDKGVAKFVGLDSKQQQRMDDVFNANRDTLLTLYKNLQHEESLLGKTTRSRELDENQIFQQIDRVTQARGELEKATAHYQLQLRKELTPEQTARLDQMAPEAQQTPQ